ncbi:ribosomal protein S6 kinase [Achlya hypogyna]|uniref:Ribosomal protein S6 kinase n=1 Tax=Achlya hypogyna TaxID=1202772 RepID=A0A1V9ZU43_ACHHY|nr:ribosomal protein S6 kinase [Achlya hypogyna]
MMNSAGLSPQMLSSNDLHRMKRLSETSHTLSERMSGRQSSRHSRTSMGPPPPPPLLLPARSEPSMTGSSKSLRSSSDHDELPPMPMGGLRLEYSPSRYTGDSVADCARMEDIIREIRLTMVTELGMIESLVPFTGSDEEFDAHPCQCKSATVFHTKDHGKSQRLLVIVPYREAGVWSRSICMNTNGDEEAGTMLTYLRKAIAEGYGVLIMNPAGQSCHTKHHVGTVWDYFVKPYECDLFILAFSRGAQNVMQLLNHDNGRGGMQHRLRALALIEPSHSVGDSDTYFARRMLSRRAVAWILSIETPAGGQITTTERRHGCICVSAGAIPSNVLGSSGGWALRAVMTSVFGVFAARCGQASGITKFTPSDKNKWGGCGLCHRKMGLLTRKLQCAWCEVKYCANCCEDKQAPVFGLWSVCKLCQILPCLIDPRKKANASAAPQSLTQMNDSDLIDRCSIFIHPDKVDDLCLSDFEIVKFIGRGACGRVKLVRKKHGADEGSFYAMKSIKKRLVVARGLVEATNAERRILDRIKHPFIATLCYAFQNDAKLYLLSHYYPGGNLLDQMRLVRHFTEERARLYAAEVTLALGHLHSNDIMYRDLKLENVLCDSEGHVALTDFGMSKENVKATERTSTFVGTYQMMAPDILTNKPYTRAIDWWALGVMVFEMIDGRTPFNAKNNKLIKEKIMTFEVPFSDRFSKDAKSFVQGLLQKKPEERLGCGPDGVEEIKRHPWFASVNWAQVYARKATFSADQELLMKTYAKEYVTVDVFDTYMHANEVACDTPTSVRGSAGTGTDLFGDFDYNHLDAPNDEDEAKENFLLPLERKADPNFDIHLLRPMNDDAELSRNNSSSTIVASDEGVPSPVSSDSGASLTESLLVVNTVPTTPEL